MRLLCVFITVLISVPVAALDIFVFSPESKAGQIQNAQTSLEKFLASEGITVKVHIFANAVDFEAAVPRIKPAFAVVSSYYHEAMAKEFQWKILLSGHLQGDEFFRKILVVENSVSKPQDLKDKALATTQFGASTQNFVAQQFLQPIGLNASSVRLITVSKDIDGLMALAVGQVSGAIVTQDSIERLKKINASAFSGMRELRKLSPLAFPKLLSFTQATDATRVRNAFRKISTSAEGVAFTRFLGITGFQ